MKKRFALIALGLILVIIPVACSKAPQMTTPQATPAETPATTHKILIMGDVLIGFKTAGLPVVDVKEYTYETDPVHLVGSPGKCVARAAFTIPWVQEDPPANEAIIEIYVDPALIPLRLEERKSVNATHPEALKTYDITYKNVALFLPCALTPDQAAEYEKVLKTL